MLPSLSVDGRSTLAILQTMTIFFSLDKSFFLRASILNYEDLLFTSHHVFAPVFFFCLPPSSLLMFARIKCAKSSFAVSLLLVRLCSLCLFFPCYPFVSPFNLLHYMFVLVFPHIVNIIFNPLVLCEAADCPNIIHVVEAKPQDTVGSLFKKDKKNRHRMKFIFHTYFWSPS